MSKRELTIEEMHAIRLRSEAATPGPWKSFSEGRDHTSGESFIRTLDRDIYLIGATAADQDFIAHAREDISRLLDELSVLRSTK